MHWEAWFNIRVAPQRRADDKPVQVIVEHIEAADGEARRRRAYNLVLAAAARAKEDAERGEDEGHKDTDHTKGDIDEERSSN